MVIGDLAKKALTQLPLYVIITGFREKRGLGVVPLQGPLLLVSKSVFEQ